MSFYDDFHHGNRVQRKVISENNFTYRHTIKTLQPLILGKNRNILDYGCGVGTVDFYIASKGSKVLGVDISKDAINMCRKSAKAIGVSERARFGELNTNIKSSYDLIICSEVIEHVSNDMDLLKNLTNRLKNSGYLFVTTPSINAPLFKLGMSNGFDRRVGHLRRYDSVKLVKQIESIGYRIISLKKEEGILRNSLFMFSFLGWIVKFLKGPLSDIVTIVDDILVRLFGESNIIILAQKI